jgi:L-ascorbate metabolism protein UlaG (beta-lactamase superfamily)
MKITKLVHSCLLVEMPAPVNRTILIDPGMMSGEAIAAADLKFLDDIVITHSHADHVDIPTVKQLVTLFPDVRVTTTEEMVNQLSGEGVGATTAAPAGIVSFDSPHQPVEPLFPTPPQIGVHVLDGLTHPGDSHMVVATMPILALPVSGPWASTITAVRLAIELKPKYVIRIHDWHLNEVARQQIYQQLERILKDNKITFIGLENGIPTVIDAVEEIPESH